MIIFYKTIKKALIILILTIIVNISLTACCEEESNIKYIHTDGLLIINGLDKYIGATIVHASAEFDEYNLTAVKNAFIDLNTLRYGCETITITDKSVRLKVYIGHNIRYNNNGRSIFSQYSDNHQNVTFLIYSLANFSIRGTVTVNFTNGVGEGVFVQDY